MASGIDWRVAWLFPSLERGNYWHPVFREFSKIYPHTRVYTGFWPGFSPGFENTFTVEVVGQTKFIQTRETSGYDDGFSYVSLGIVNRLLQFNPHVIFASGFSLWTLLGILLKPIGGWKLIIAYEGSAPGVDYRHSPLRLWLRRSMAHFSDAFITNSLAGKAYLTHVLGVKEQLVHARPYEVPDVQALVKTPHLTEAVNLQYPRPIFLFTGQLIPRKGVRSLLEACRVLKERGYCQYTLLIVGDGPLRQELQALSEHYDLDTCIHWLGWISYSKLGTYFDCSDVFVLPTLEDTWGMVVLESMAFGKPVLCSTGAGTSELVVEGENGYRFNPEMPEAIADVMQYCLDHPQLLPIMGQKSRELIAQYTPVTAVQFLVTVIASVLPNSKPDKFTSAHYDRA